MQKTDSNSENIIRLHENQGNENPEKKGKCGGGRSFQEWKADMKEDHPKTYTALKAAAVIGVILAIIAAVGAGVIYGHFGSMANFAHAVNTKALPAISKFFTGEMQVWQGFAAVGGLAAAVGLTVLAVKGGKKAVDKIKVKIQEAREQRNEKNQKAQNEIDTDERSKGQKVKDFFNNMRCCNKKVVYDTY